MSGILGGGGKASQGVNVPSSLLVNAGNRRLQTNATSPGKFVTQLINEGSAAQTAENTRFPRVLSDLDTLRGTLTPGFSDLRAARSAQIGGARNRAIGNLRQSLSQRRVLGSSFGEQALISAEREFADAQAASEAQSFLEELDANQRILAFESAQINDALNRELTELGIASGQSAQLASLNSQVSQFAAELRAQESSNRSSSIGSLLGTAAGFAVGGPLGGALGGSLGSSIGGFVGGRSPVATRRPVDLGGNIPFSSGAIQ